MDLSNTARRTIESHLRTGSNHFLKRVRPTIPVVDGYESRWLWVGNCLPVSPKMIHKYAGQTSWLWTLGEHPKRRVISAEGSTKDDRINWLGRNTIIGTYVAYNPMSVVPQRMLEPMTTKCIWVIVKAVSQDSHERSTHTYNEFGACRYKEGDDIFVERPQSRCPW